MTLFLPSLFSYATGVFTCPKCRKWDIGYYYSGETRELFTMFALLVPYMCLKTASDWPIQD